MIKVAIADDELMIREGLRDAFDWNDHGYSIVGLCKNGQEAYEMGLCEKPDIFLVDICLPILNGLDLIEKLKEVNPETIYIIITGHSEFEYAHRAIKMGVYDFVVKPIDEDRLWQILKKAKDTLINKSSSKAENDFMKLQMTHHLSEMRSEFLFKLITRGYEDSQVIEKKLKHLELDFGQTPGMLFIKPLSSLSGEKRWSDQLLFFAYSNLINEILAEDNLTVVITRDLDDRIIVLMSTNDNDAFAKYEKKIETSIKTYLGQQSRVVGLALKKNLEDVRECYRQLEKESGFEYGELVMEVKRIVDYEFANNNLDLNEISNRLSVSTSHLSRLVKKELGLSFKEYLIEKRIEKAKELVRNTDLRFNEIALIIGYSNQHYFTRAFKKIVGFSPSEYRRF
jgi:two-component system, response regulator YesN